MKWIGQLWRGDFALGRAFWVFGVLIPVLGYFVTKYLSMALMVLMLVIGFSGPSAPAGLLNGSLFIFFAMVALTLAYQVLAAVGIWRSASKFEGKLLYSMLARAVVAIYFALIVGGIAVAVQTWFNTNKG
jgi:hypothetical protein